MLMQKINTGMTGAKRQSYNENNPRPILKNLMEKHPHAEVDELIPMFCSEIGAEDADGELLAVIAYWVTNNYHTLFWQMTRDDATEIKTVQAAARQRGVAAGLAGVTAIVERKALIILSDVLPSGKKLGDTTFAELGDLGGVFLKISKQGRPEQLVRAVLTNGDLRLLQS